MKEKITILTGATGGLGRAFAKTLCENQQNILITGTSEEKLIALKKELNERHPSIQILYKSCDLKSEEDIDGLVKYIQSLDFSPQMLINNAGYITEGSIQEVPNESLLDCIKVNCLGTISLTKKILDIRDTRDAFRIINVTSMAGLYPMPYMAIYSSTKAMLNNFMTALRYEYRDKKVKVLIVEPGAIPTTIDMQKAIQSQGLKGRLSAVSPEIIAKNAYAKSLKNKKTYIPGFFNKFTVFISNFVTTNFKCKMAGKMWRKSQNKRGIK